MSHPFSERYSVTVNGFWTFNFPSTFLSNFNKGVLNEGKGSFEACYLPEGRVEDRVNKVLRLLLESLGGEGAVLKVVLRPEPRGPQRLFREVVGRPEVVLVVVVVVVVVILLPAAANASAEPGVILVVNVLVVVVWPGVGGQDHLQLDEHMEQFQLLNIGALVYK